MQILSNTGNPNWTNLNLSTAPSARDSYAMAYDHGAFADRAVWRHGSQRHLDVHVPFHLDAEDAQHLARRAVRRRYVVAGVAEQRGAFRQARSPPARWAKPGRGTARTGPRKLPARVLRRRSYPAMGPDSTHHQVLLFGGSTDGTAGERHQRHLHLERHHLDQADACHHRPPQSFGASIADGPTGAILFGGEDATGTPLGQTYVWNGSNWFFAESAHCAPRARLRQHGLRRRRPVRRSCSAASIKAARCKTRGSGTATSGRS